MHSMLRLTQLAPLAFALMSSAALAATVTLSPTGNHPQGTTQISGSGFGASEPVDVYFDTTDEVLAIADASGNFGPDTITIPATALPGTHAISAVGRRTSTEAQHSFRVRTNWDSHGFNASGERRNPYENVIDATNVTSLALAWSASTGGAISSSPAVAQITDTYNPTIFVGSGDGYLYAFDSKGRHVWKKATGGAVNSSPAISGTTVYVGSADGKLYAFQAASGSPAWPSPATTGGSIVSSPVVVSGIVYVGSNDGKLYAFHASDGTPAWASPAATNGAISRSSPSVADGIVYIGSSDSNIYALDASTGHGVWSFGASGIIYSNPMISGGDVYFGSENRSIFIMDAATGDQRSTTRTGGAVSSSAAIANNVVYIGSTDGKLYALPVSGARGWTATLAGAASYTSAAVANGVVYIGGGSSIEAFNTGGCGSTTCSSPLWSATTGGTVTSSPTISDGVLYVGSSDHKLYAYALSGGDTPAYTFRNRTRPPSRASLHPDMRLRSTRH